MGLEILHMLNYSIKNVDLLITVKNICLMMGGCAATWHSYSPWSLATAPRMRSLQLLG